MSQGKIKYFNELNRNFLQKIKSKKVVLCHGVFDILHIGHLNHFEESKSFGNLLIVSITRDEFVRKGPNRPVFKSYQRAKMISSLKCVDYVVINNSETAENIIKKLKPNVYAKGIDYSDQKKDLTNNIKNEIKAIKSVNGTIKITQTQKFDSSKILNQFDLIYTNEQKQMWLRRWRRP